MMLPCHEELVLTNALLQRLALVLADLTWLVRSVVTDGKRVVAQRWYGVLTALVCQPRKIGYHQSSVYITAKKKTRNI